MQNGATAWAWPWWTVMVLINAVNLMLCVWILLRTTGSVDEPDWKYLALRSRPGIAGAWQRFSRRPD